jgi:hypothetical protein
MWLDAFFYMWLDAEGKIVWISNLNESTYQRYKGTDLSYREYFSVPRETAEAYYSSVIDSNMITYLDSIFLIPFLKIAEHITLRHQRMYNSMA